MTGKAINSLSEHLRRLVARPIANGIWENMANPVWHIFYRNIMEKVEDHIRSTTTPAVYPDNKLDAL